MYSISARCHNKILIQTSIWLVCFARFAILQSYDPLWKWEFDNVYQHRVLAERKGKQETEFELQVNQNFGEILNGTSLEWNTYLNAHVASFNGKSSGVIIDNLTDICLTHPVTRCNDGFTVSFWVKYEVSKDAADTFIFSSTYFSIRHLLQITQVEILNKENGRRWTIVVEGKQSTSWRFITITWHPRGQLVVYRDGNKLGSEGEEEGKSFLNHPQNSHFAFGTAATSNRKILFNEFQLWERNMSAKEVQDIYQKAFEGVGNKNKMEISHSSPEYRDRKLSGYVIKTIKVLEGKHCYLKCIREKQCRSYNVQYNSSNITSTCEVNNASKYDVEDWRFIRHKNFVYYDLL